MALLLVVAGCGFRIDVESGVSGTTDDGGNGVAADAASPTDSPFVNTDANLAACPANYVPINGIGRYRVDDTSKTWTDAAQDCNDDAAGSSIYTHLLVLGTEAERTTITSSSTVNGNTWIGLSDRAVEGTFVWVTSEPTGGYPVVGQSPPWDTDDPDNADGGEDCVRFKNSFVLEDKPCGDEQSFICECDAFAPN